MGIRVNKLLRFFRGHEPDVNALSAQLDGQLDAAAAARLDEHVAACEACRSVRDGLRSTRDALRAMPAATPARSFRLRVADVEAAAARAPRAPQLTRWAPAGMVAAAVAIAVVGAYVTFGRSGSTSSTSELAAARPATSASGAQSSNATNSATGKSAPGPSGDAPSIANSPVGADAATPAFPPLPQAAADGSVTTDASSPAAAVTAPYSGSTTPTPAVAAGLQAVRASEDVRNKTTAAIVQAITW